MQSSSGHGFRREGCWFESELWRDLIGGGGGSEGNFGCGDPWRFELWVWAGLEV